MSSGLSSSAAKRAVVIVLEIISASLVCSAQLGPSRAASFFECVGNIPAPATILCTDAKTLGSSIGGPIALTATVTSPDLQRQMTADLFAQSAFGSLRLHNSATFNIEGSAGGAVALTNAGFQDVIIIDFPPFRGQQGFLIIDYELNGTIASQGAAGAAVSVHAIVSNVDGSNMQDNRVWYTSSVSGIFRIPQVFRFIYGQPFVLGFALLSENGTVFPGRLEFRPTVGQGTGTLDFSNTLVIVGLGVLDSTGSILSGPPTFTSASGTEYSLDGVLRPFERFSARASLEPNEGEFDIKGRFMLGAGSNGIDPANEGVTLQVGTFSATIPAGAFRLDKHGRFRFEGLVNGAALQISIRRLDENEFRFSAQGRGVSVARTKDPVILRLIVGNDGGTTLSGEDDDCAIDSAECLFQTLPH